MLFCPGRTDGEERNPAREKDKKVGSVVYSVVKKAFSREENKQECAEYVYLNVQCSMSSVKSRPRLKRVSFRSLRYLVRSPPTHN